MFFPSMNRGKYPSCFAFWHHRMLCLAFVRRKRQLGALPVGRKWTRRTVNFQWTLGVLIDDLQLSHGVQQFIENNQQLFLLWTHRTVCCEPGIQWCNFCLAYVHAALVFEDPVQRHCLKSQRGDELCWLMSG